MMKTRTNQPMQKYRCSYKAFKWSMHSQKRKFWVFLQNEGREMYSTGIAMLLSNVFCRDATRSAKKINPHANPALNPRNSRAKPSLFPR